jgi:hypothetical protein
MPPAVVAGGIAAAGAIGGAVIGSSAQKKAASQAAGAQAGATEAQLQLGRESMALNKDIYNANFGVLSPYASRGNVAGDSINALLGLPSAPTMTSPLATASGGAGSAQGQAPYTQAQIDAMWHDGIPGNAEAAQKALAAWNKQQGQAKTNPVAAQQPLGQTQAPAATGTPSSTPMSQLDALTNFSNSAGMKFALEQGAKSVNHGAAGNGWLESGAAMKALQQRGQDIALQQYFPMYTGLLGQQQAVGAGAASSIAGVGQNFGNTAANINAGMGANIQNGANAASNAALLKGQANAQMWSGIGSGLGSFASSFVPLPKAG